jgi:hypothetical protein
MSQNHGRGRTGDQFDEKIVIVRGALKFQKRQNFDDAKSDRLLVAAAVIGMLGLEVGEKMSVPGVSGVISPAHAVIGRPGTPRSVAGVARRTYRRCATGVYRC